MSFQLLSQGPCPSCGAPIQFRAPASAAQVCKHCNFVIVRTDRNFQAVGRVADLVSLQSPFAVGASGTLGNRQFIIEGKVQYDRAQAPGAPWEEFYLAFADGSWSWLANAQGRWYLTSAIPVQFQLPTYQQARPGIAIHFPNLGPFQITEQGARRPLSSQGELPFVVEPNSVEYYADLSGPNGGFGTVDYGTGRNAPVVYVGQIIDPRTIKMSGGAELMAEAPKAALQSLTCPGCGGNLPLAAPERTERVVCRFCGTSSNVNQGVLQALGKLPKPSAEPVLPLGTQGKLRGRDVMVIGFVVRYTEDDEGRYPWNEYLLYAGAEGFFWLLEEDGRWEFIETLHIGNVGKPSEDDRVYQAATYSSDGDPIYGVVESVVGEFYWRVEAGETVTISNFEGPGGQKLSEEEGNGEIVLSHSSPLPPSELAQAFPSVIKAKDWKAAKTGPKSLARVHLFWGALLLLWMIISVMGCATAKNELILNRELPLQSVSPTAALTPDKNDHSVFSDPFPIVRGGRSLDIDVTAPGLNNNWLGADVALVNLDTGDVWEDSFNLEFYSGTASGVDDGESWSESWTEGSRSKSLVYGRLPEGKYIFRIEPSFDGTTPPSSLSVSVRSDTPPIGSSIFVLFGLLGLWLLTWISARIFGSSTK